MSKQIASRNQKSKGFRPKKTLQICLLLAICIWFIYEVNQLYKNKAIREKASKASPEDVETTRQIKILGRKDINSQLDELAAQFEIRHDKEMELEDDEINLLESEEEPGTGNANDEASEKDQGRTEEGEHEQLEDFIDEDDKEGGTES